MPEIERKFVVEEPPPLDGWRAQRLEQGYIAVNDSAEVRIRRVDGGASRLTVKSAPGLSRVEEELELEDPDAFERLWPLTEGRRVEKTRWTREDDGVVLELDIYEGTLSGLVVLEAEFPSEEAAGAWTPPVWASREVTGEKAYANQSLALYGAP